MVGFSCLFFPDKDKDLITDRVLLLVCILLYCNRSFDHDVLFDHLKRFDTIIDDIKGLTFLQLLFPENSAPARRQILFAVRSFYTAADDGEWEPKGVETRTKARIGLEELQEPASTRIKGDLLTASLCETLDQQGGMAAAAGVAGVGYETAAPHLNSILSPFDDATLLETHREELLELLFSKAPDLVWMGWLYASLNVAVRADNLDAFHTLFAVCQNYANFWEVGTRVLREVLAVVGHAASYGSSQVLSALLEFEHIRSEVREVDEGRHSLSPLFEAAREGHLKCVVLLTKAGAPLEYKWFMGGTALTVAVEYGREGVVLELLAAGADVENTNDQDSLPMCTINYPNYTPLGIAAEKNDERMVGILLAAGASFGRNRTETTPVSIAAAAGSCASLKRLLEAGADANVVNSRGQSALHIACCNSHEGAVELLLRHNASVSPRCDYGLTPSDVVAMRALEKRQTRTRVCTLNEEETAAADRIHDVLHEAGAWARRGWLVMLRARRCVAVGLLDELPPEQTSPVEQDPPCGNDGENDGLEDGLVHKAEGLTLADARSGDTLGVVSAPEIRKGAVPTKTLLFGGEHDHREDRSGGGWECAVEWLGCTMADLGKRFVSEMLGMMVVISIGNGAIANEVLKKTKGHELGLGFVAIAYGLAFFLAISMFGHISANVNPAMLVAKALIGRLSWKDTLALSVANVCGGFLGGVVVYCLYFAHFSIVPERPSPPRWDDALVDATYAPPAHTRNAYISYEPRHRSRGDGDRRKVVFRRDAARDDGNFFGGLERSNSLQVGTILHEHEKARDPTYSAAGGGAGDPQSVSYHEPRAKGGLPRAPPNADRARSSPAVRSTEPPALDEDEACGSKRGARAAAEHDAEAQRKRSSHAGLRLRQLAGIKFGGVQLHEALSLPPGSRPPRRSFRFGLCSGAPRKESHTGGAEDPELMSQLEMDGITKKDVAAYRGLVIADQNAKLAAFASRPAVLNYATNTVAEIIGTFSLIWYALMLEERVNLLDTPDAADNLMPIIGPFLIGFLVVGLVTAMAGPTGYAANPARDLGPRIAHFVLPIPNKGPSEWYYAFVPIVGPLCGGFLGAAAFYGCIQLNDYPDWFEGETNTFGGSWDL
eukprot:g7099.t1